MTDKYEGIPWLSDEDYAKVYGQMKLIMPGAFRSFQVKDVEPGQPIQYRYGLEADVLQTIEEVCRR